jgi:redox-sensing transcriptional repressor
VVASAVGVLVIFPAGCGSPGGGGGSGGIGEAGNTPGEIEVVDSEVTVAKPKKPNKPAPTKPGPSKPGQGKPSGGDEPIVIDNGKVVAKNPWVTIPHPDRFKPITQPDDISCGPTCIAMVLGYYGKSAGIGPIKTKAGTQWFSAIDWNGKPVKFGMTHPNNMVAPLESYGVAADRAKGQGIADIKRCIDSGRPCILLVRSGWDTWHYITAVAYHRTDGLIRIADPGDGKFYNLSESQIATGWRYSGYYGNGHVPGDAKCKPCGGSGWYQTPKVEFGDCPVCSGSGRAKIVVGQGRFQYKKDVGECKPCGGSGKVKAREGFVKTKCNICDGDGKLGDTPRKAVESVGASGGTLIFPNGRSRAEAAGGCETGRGDREAEPRAVTALTLNRFRATISERDGNRDEAAPREGSRRMKPDVPVSERRHRISLPAVRRMSLYLRQLELFQARHRKTTSSKQLAESLGLTDAQVRKDLASAGQFGHPGIGYRVEELIKSLKRILGIDRTWNVVIIGAGNLGRALVSYRGFLKKGFHIVGIFDSDAGKIGGQIGGHPVYGMDSLERVVRDESVRMAILAVPADAAQDVADRLVAAGVQGLLSFAPVALTVPDDVSLEVADVAAQMEQLSFRVTARRIKPAGEGADGGEGEAHEGAEGHGAEGHESAAAPGDSVAGVPTLPEPPADGDEIIPTIPLRPSAVSDSGDSHPSPAAASSASPASSGPTLHRVAMPTSAAE